MRASGFTFAATLVAVGLVGVLSAAQTLSPGEVTIRGGPYRPLTTSLRVGTNVVQVGVVVRDSQGRPVGGLTKADFTVVDSGRRCELTEFGVETSGAGSAAVHSPAPTVVSPSGMPAAVPGRWIVILFDDINTPAGDLVRSKIAARRFINEAAEAGDRIGVFTTSQGQVLDFTADSHAVLKSIDAVESHPRMEAAGMTACPRITPYEAYQITRGDVIALQAKAVEACACPEQPNCDPTVLQTMNPSDIGNGTFASASLGPLLKSLVSKVLEQARMTWDQTRAVTQTTLDSVQASVGDLAKRPGKRLLLFSSSGFISGDLQGAEDEIIDEALKAGVVISSIDSKGLYSEPPGGSLGQESQSGRPDLTMLHDAQTLGDRLDSEDSAMADLAESTGGLLFQNNNDLNFGFRQLGLEPSVAYELGFQPREDGKFHEIKVQVKNTSHYMVQARSGYFAPMKGTKIAKAPTLQQQLDAEVSSSEDRSDFPVAVTRKTVSVKGALGLSVQTHVDIEKLPFEQRQDRHVDSLTFVAALLDAQGRLVVGKEAQMQFALKSDSFERFSQSGINADLTLAAQPGAYRLRVVVEEGSRAEISATTQDIQIQ